MRLLWLAIRLYPESAAARRLVIVSLLGLFCAAAGIAALVALVYRNAPALEGSLGAGSPVLTALREPVALDELYALRARLVDYRPDEIDGSALRRLLGEPGLIAALLEDEEAAAATAAHLASEDLRA